MARGAESGSLAPIQDSGGCFHSLAALYSDCTLTQELGGAHDVAVSPDGEHVYVAASADSAVVGFDRDPVSGLLTPGGCVNEDGSGGCEDGRALDGATSLSLSQDGANVYVASTGVAGGIAIFDRDASSGVLTQKGGTDGCINETGADGCSDGVDQMLDLRDVELAPDGKSAYAVSRNRNAVTVYTRDGSTGALAPLPLPDGCINESGGGGCQNGKALIRAESITISPDGTSAYVAGERSDAIAIFDRRNVDGQLTQKAGTAGCVSNTGRSDQLQSGTTGDCADGVAMDGINSIAILPDGSALYATTDESSGVTVFERHFDGTLAQRPGVDGCITETGYEDTGLPWTAGYCQDGSALSGANHVVASADSRFVYATALNGGVDIFDVTEPPQPPAGTVQSPVSQPSSSDQACKQARADRKLAAHRFRHARRTVLRLVRQSGGAIGTAQQRALAKARRIARTWSKRLHRAERRMTESCSVA